ncbi:MAG: FHA domain-containing protein, partial [Anaerolineae bacterium]|nr:FHA domain-containing protein [Anaerolineae bacterium]
MAQYRLVVKRGPNPNQIFELNGDVHNLGRDITNDIVINDREASRHHLRISHSVNGYMVEDLGSTNGTFLNGKRMTGAEEIKPGDMIGLGETVTLEVQVVSDSKAAQTSSVNEKPVAATEMFQETIIGGNAQPVANVVPPHQAVTPGKKLQIFISYRKTNRKQVDDITRVLKDMGHSIWFDQD